MRNQVISPKTLLFAILLLLLGASNCELIAAIDRNKIGNTGGGGGQGGEGASGGTATISTGQGTSTTSLTTSHGGEGGEAGAGGTGAQGGEGGSGGEAGAGGTMTTGQGGMGGATTTSTSTTTITTTSSTSDCPSGTADCDGDPADCETNTVNDSGNCGGCGIVCPANLPICLGAVCVPTCGPQDLPVAVGGICIEVGSDILPYGQTLGAVVSNDPAPDGSVVNCVGGVSAVGKDLSLACMGQGLSVPLYVLLGSVENGKLASYPCNVSGGSFSCTGNPLVFRNMGGSGLAPCNLMNPGQSGFHPQHQCPTQP